MPVSRRNFVELCRRLTGRDEQAYAGAWRQLGLSVDWSTEYHDRSATGAGPSRSAAFLRNLARGEAYLAEAPSLWDVTFGTAVAQAELEDRRVAGAYHRLAFRLAATVTGRLARSWWRPPGPSCCPPAWRWSRTRTTSGTRRCSAGPRVTPLFGAAVPVLAHHLAEPGKGTGIVDGVHLRRHDRRDLVARPAAADPGPLIGQDGRRRSRPRAWTTRPGGPPTQQLAGLTVTAARRQGGGAAAGRRAGCAASRSRSPTR